MKTSRLGRSADATFLWRTALLAVLVSTRAAAGGWETRAAVFDNWELELYPLESHGAFAIAPGGAAATFVRGTPTSNSEYRPTLFFGTEVKEPATGEMMGLAVKGGGARVPAGLFVAVIDPAIWARLATGALGEKRRFDRILLWLPLDAPADWMERGLSRFQGRSIVLALAWWAPDAARARLLLPSLEIRRFAPPASPAAGLLSALDGRQMGGGPTAADSIARTAAYFRRRLSAGGPAAGLTAADRSAADLLLSDRWLLHWQGDTTTQLSEPVPIDWRKNPIDDPEWVWHLHWLDRFGPLARAYGATGDERYARKWVEIFRDWFAQNPPGTPWSWRSLDASIRARALLEQIPLLARSQAVTDEDLIKVLATLHDTGVFLLEPSKFHAQNNWGVSETVSLDELAAAFPEMTDAAAWRRAAASRVLSCLRAQVMPDGSSVEMTTGYHIDTLNNFLQCAKLFRDSGREAPAELTAAIEKMYDYILCLAKPDGSLPMLGHSYPRNARDTLLDGAARFARPDLLYVGSGGSRGRPPGSLDTFLPDSQHYVMRSDWTDPEALYLLVKGTSRGRPGMDGFNLELYAYGRTLIEDSGAFSYHDPYWSEFFAATTSHSTVTIAGADQTRNIAGRIRAFVRRPDASFFDGTLEIYPGVWHRRQVIFAHPPDPRDPGYFLVTDRVTGAKPGEVVCAFQMPPEPIAFDAAGASAHTFQPEQGNLLVQSLYPAGVVARVREGWISHVYNLKQPRPVVEYEMPGLPAAFITLLLPYKNHRGTPPAVTVQSLEWDRTTGRLAVTLQGDRWVDRISVPADDQAAATEVRIRREIRE